MVPGFRPALARPIRNALIGKGCARACHEKSIREAMSEVLAAREAACELNVIDVGAGSALTLGNTVLSDTQLKLGAGATIAVDGTLAIAAGHPVEVQLAAGFDGSVLSLPVAKGELKAEDFVISGRGVLRVVTEGGVQYLKGCNFAGGTFNETTGYVVMTNSDGSSANTFLTASFGKRGEDNTKNGANMWSNGELPFAGTNYYTNGKYIRNGKSVTFGGDWLVQGNGLRIGGGKRSRLMTGCCWRTDTRPSRLRR